jgi:hypothetical protein
VIRLVFALALASATAFGAAQAPQDFAYGVPIETTEQATAYSFPLALAVYRGSVGADLADIRIFNAQGDVVPYALRRSEAKSGTPTPAQPLALFPLHGDAHVLIDGVRVTIDSADTSVNLQTQHGGADTTMNPAAAQYVIDARALDAPIAALELAWPETAAEYSGRVRVEASDDLGAWRTVIAAAPIANLHANGRELIERRIELPAMKSRFWRLVWLGAAPPFELSAVLADPADSPQQERAELDVAGDADPQKPNAYDFDLGARLPVDRVSLLLPELNTLLTVDLESRANAQAAWRRVLSTGFYRLKTAAGEQANAPVAIGLDHDRYWRAVLATSDATQGALKLQVFYTPSQVVFLARGTGPFGLAYGNAQAVNAEADLKSIPSSIPIAQATLGPERVLGGADRLKGAAAPFPLERTILWVVLGLGVAMLSFMALRLAKDGVGRPQ